MAAPRMMRLDKEFRDMLEMIKNEHGLSYLKASKEIGKSFKKGDGFPDFGSLKRQRRGQIQSLIAVLLVFVLFLIVLFQTLKILDETNSAVQNIDVVGQEGKDILDDNVTAFPTVFDGAALFILVILWIAIIASTFLLDSHPFFFVITLFAYVFIFILVAIFANMLDDYTAANAFADQLANLTIIPFILQNFLPIFIIMAFSGAISLYAKARSDVL